MKPYYEDDLVIAARDSGRRAIGIDIREDQCEIAARRQMLGAVAS